MTKTPLACLLLSLALHGCRCGPSEDLLPASRSADPASRPGCPPLPAWAPPPGPQVEADLLHASDTHGTGYRLHTDGHLETYDDMEVLKTDAGRVKLDRVPGRWRDRGQVAASGLEALRNTIAAASAEQLQGARTGKGGDATRTHLFLRRDGQTHAFCYLGDQAPADLAPIEKAMHDLMKHLGDAAAPAR